MRTFGSHFVKIVSLNSFTCCIFLRVMLMPLYLFFVEGRTQEWEQRWQDLGDDDDDDDDDGHHQDNDHQMVMVN